MTSEDRAAPPDQAKIFVSYSHADRPWVTNLVRELQSAGLSVWLDAQRLRPGTEWDSEIEHALQRTGVLMVILSPDSVKSRNVLDEINYALSKDRLVVPVLYRPCEVPYRVARIQHVDFSGNDPMALIHLVDYLKAAVDSHVACAGSAEPRSGDPAERIAAQGRRAPVGLAPLASARTIPTLSRASLLLLALPSAILLALAIGAMYWPATTPVTLEVVTRRVSFVVGANNSDTVLNRSPEFSELKVEGCSSMSFLAAEFAPEPATGAPPIRSGTGSTPVAFTCRPDNTSAITLRAALEQPTLVGLLDNLRVDPAATVVLDVAEGSQPVLTVDISGSRSQALHIPIHTALRIVTSLTGLSQPQMPPDVSHSLESDLSFYRARLPESDHYIDIQTGARTVLVVTPLTAKDFFPPNSSIPVDSVQFLDDPLGGKPQTAVRQATVSYAGVSTIAPVRVSDDFLVLDQTKDMHILKLGFDPEGLRLILQGGIVKGAVVPRTPGGPQQRVDLRLTAFQTIRNGPFWRIALALGLWLTATLGLWSLLSRRAAPGPPPPALAAK